MATANAMVTENAKANVVMATANAKANAVMATANAMVTEKAKANVVMATANEKVNVATVTASTTSEVAPNTNGIANAKTKSFADDSVAPTKKPWSASF